MERIDAQSVLAKLEGMSLQGHASRMLAALGDATDGTEVIFGRIMVSDILPGLLIRLKTTPDVDQRVPGFRDLLEGLRRLAPEAWVEDYALMTETEIHRIFLTGEPATLVGAYVMARTSANRRVPTQDDT